jgi:hypothetical protein
MVALGLAMGTSRQWSWAEYGHSHPAILRGWLALNESVSKKHHDLIFAGTKHHPRKMNLKHSFGTCSCWVLVAQNLCTSTQPIPGFHPHRPIERLCSNNSRIDARKILTCLGKRTQKFVWGVEPYQWQIWEMTNLTLKKYPHIVSEPFFVPQKFKSKINSSHGMGRKEF